MSPKTQQFHQKKRLSKTKLNNFPPTHTHAPKKKLTEKAQPLVWIPGQLPFHVTDPSRIHIDCPLKHRMYACCTNTLADAARKLSFSFMRSATTSTEAVATFFAWAGTTSSVEKSAIVAARLVIAADFESEQAASAIAFGGLNKILAAEDEEAAP